MQFTAGQGLANVKCRVRRHLPFLVLLPFVAAAIAAFCRGAHLATLGDDSPAYLVLAQVMQGSLPEVLKPWASRHANFGPLFPMALAAVGGGTDWAIAHQVVAVFMIAARGAVYAYGTVRAGAYAGLLLVLVTLMLPTTWVSIRGILSESLFMAVSFFALWHFVRRLEDRDGEPRDWLIFALLLALALLARTAGIALVVAYGVHASIRLYRARGSRAGWLALPVIISLLAQFAWIELRPAGEDSYARVGAS